MITSLFLAGWISTVAAWTPMTAFNLTCSGTQTAYEDTMKINKTMPWSETFKIDLVGGTFCSQGCAKRFALSAVTPAGLDLQNTQSQYGSSLRRFNAADGSFTATIAVPSSATVAFHLQQTGTCRVGPLASGT